MRLSRELRSGRLYTGDKAVLHHSSVAEAEVVAAGRSAVVLCETKEHREGGMPEEASGIGSHSEEGEGECERLLRSMRLVTLKILS